MYHIAKGTALCILLLTGVSCSPEQDRAATEATPLNIATGLEIDPACFADITVDSPLSDDIRIRDCGGVQPYQDPLGFLTLSDDDNAVRVRVIDNSFDMATIELVASDPGRGYRNLLISGAISGDHFRGGTISVAVRDAMPAQISE